MCIFNDNVHLASFDGWRKFFTRRTIEKAIQLCILFIKNYLQQATRMTENLAYYSYIFGQRIIYDDAVQE